MKELSAIKYEVRKSRFFAFLYLVDSPDDVSVINDMHRKMYKKAAHHCCALNFKSADCERSEFKNDGEVGNPGRVLLKVLEQKNLNMHCLIVSRIFGGVKLGPAGVSKAFREAGLAAVALYLE